MKLSERTTDIIRKLFAPEDFETVCALMLEECGRNLPGLHRTPVYELERFWLAALRISEGNHDRLLQAIQLAQADWRDLLMAADFGESLGAHKVWYDEMMKS